VKMDNEGNREGAVVEVPERPIRLHGPEDGPADTDIDDVANAFAGVSFPLTAADAVRKCSHLVEHGMNSGNDVVAVHDNRRAPRHAQRHVEDGPVFPEVDFLTSEHRVDSLAQPPLLRESSEQPDPLLV